MKCFVYRQKLDFISTPPPTIDERGDGECGGESYQGFPKVEMLLGRTFIPGRVDLGVSRIPPYGA